MLVVLGIAGIAALAVFGLSEWSAGRTTLAFIDRDVTVSGLELTVFADKLAFTSPSPPPPLGSIELQGSLTTTLDRGLAPERAVIRYRGAGVGTGVVYVKLGEPVPPITLEAPRTIRGRVGEPIGFWSFGWRCSGMRPVAGAEVVAMAGGEHGIELGAATTNADGSFELAGIAPSVHPVSLRVRAKGYGITHLEAPAALDAEATAALQRTIELRGRITVPAGVDPTRLCVLARGLPGVQAWPAADGTFVLDHIPAALVPRLLVHGLDAFHACPEVRAQRDDEVELVVHRAGVVHGVVIDERSGAPQAGAFVFAGEGATARTEADGTFVLEGVLPGRVRLSAQFQPERKPRQRRQPKRFGSVPIMVTAGGVVDGIRITIAER